jgi:pyrroline-5-carboxylate reductase
VVRVADVPIIGFLGAGRMASALARGWIQAGLTSPDRIIAADPSAAARETFERETASQAFLQNLHIVASADLIVLAVKPQTIAQVFAEIRPALAPRHLVVSIVAGATLAQLAKALGESTRIIRVMPNTPSLVGACAAAIAAGASATADDLHLIERLFAAIGVAHRLPEKLLDAVTGLSGSGPAYVAVMIEALSDGGVAMGLPRDVATALAAQTVLGTAKLLLETGMHPGQIKDMVASPGGTTIAGLHALERAGVRGALMDAVQAATKRAQELTHETK